MEAEFGSGISMTFSPNFTLRDSDGKKINIPECSKCHQQKMALIGKEAMCWICIYCPHD